MIKNITFFFFTLSFYFNYGQTVELLGEVKSNSEIENIHVINKTAHRFTITDRNGEFKIEAKLKDTIIFSSVQHVLKEVVVGGIIISTKKIKVILEDHVNELDEVIVGKILTGNLFSDIQSVNLDDAPINFFDVGIPGYTGKIATQSERKLSEAGEFKPIMLLGLLGGSLPLNPIINGLSGRTKMLKKRVEIDERDALMRSVKARLSKDFLASNPLEKDLIMDFFYFCSDDENFIKYCKNKTDFNVLIFLRHKYRQYMENRKEVVD